MRDDVVTEEERDETPDSERLKQELETAARLESDQLIAELVPVAHAAGRYYRELIAANTPDELAHELVVDWQRFYFTGD